MFIWFCVSMYIYRHTHIIWYICVILYTHIFMLYIYVNTTNLWYTQARLNELYFYFINKFRKTLIQTLNTWSALLTTIHLVAAYPKARWTRLRKGSPEWDPGLTWGLIVTAAKRYTLVDYSFDGALQFFVKSSQFCDLNYFIDEDIKVREIKNFLATESFGIIAHFHQVHISHSLGLKIVLFLCPQILLAFPFRFPTIAHTWSWQSVKDFKAI